MLDKIAEKYYDKGYNCAESIVHAGNELYHLGLSEHDMRITGWRCLWGDNRSVLYFILFICRDKSS